MVESCTGPCEGFDVVAKGRGDPLSVSGWDLAGIDPTKANVARVYDAMLGGSHNFVADREVARAMETLDRRIPAACRANRAFLGRAVRFLAGQAGVRQFLDIGSGIPAAGNVHEIAQHIAADTKVVYVDHDPVAVAYSRAILAGHERATVIEADLREPGEILSHPDLRRLIDFAEPAAMLFVSILHFLTEDDDPYGTVARFRDAAAPGSFMVVSHVTSQNDPRLAEAVQRLYTARAADGKARSRDEIAGFFGGWEMTEPGLVYVPQWRPDPPDDVPPRPEQFWFLGGVACKPRVSLLTGV
jgi:hypothetical protein